MITNDSDRSREFSIGKTAFANEWLRLPNPKFLFRNRSRRFRQLAGTKPVLSGFLSLMADLAEMQQEISDVLSQSFAPPNDGNTGPPLDVSCLVRDSIWRTALRHMAKNLNAPEDPIAEILHKIELAPDDELEDWAKRLLDLGIEHLDAGIAPFLAAALQVQWTGMAARLDSSQIVQTKPGYLCPACGFLPVASVLQTGGSVAGLRYLCCSLCATEWNQVRINCVTCGSGKSIAYYRLEGANDQVKAEACGECRTYLKIMNRERDSGVDPFADDLATLALDVLMAEEGFNRLGLNPFMVLAS